MRGSDIVDLGLEIVPQWVKRALLLGVLFWVAVTGNIAPVTWYVQDKAAGLVEAMSGFTDALTPHIIEATVPTLTPPTPQP